MRLRVEGWTPAAMARGDDADHTFATRVTAPCDGHLRFEGIATLATVLIDGVLVAESRSMWVPVKIPLAAGEHAVEVRCRALAPELAVPRKPRARWRQKVAADNNLRWFRTTLHGRAPGFSPGPPEVGLWRPVFFVAGEPRVSVRTRLDGDVGVVLVRTDAPDDTPVALAGTTTTVRDGTAELRVDAPRRWWPHTHGEPALYDLAVGGQIRRVGFRTLEVPEDVLADGLRVRINGVDVFVRGALWTPVADEEVRSTLATARDHGLNAVRLPGTLRYESAAFHDACDELGLLVWQDLMFANLDYPFVDDDFRAQVDAELGALLEEVGGRPSLFCVCGGSEIEQQVAMLGLDPALGRPPFLAEDVPARLAIDEVDAVYVPSAPCGADRPLLAGQGVSNWFGVGGYRRPFAEIRAAGVRFASECLALANVGDESPHPHDPAWKDGVPGDVGADWDFDDVRDHYLAAIFGVEPDALRAADPDRWLALSRRVGGIVMSEVLGEWRRAGDPCGGAFVLWLRDLVPGAGWGLLDSAGRPKPVLRDLRAVLAPTAIWMTDEHMGGYAIHVANDGPERLVGTVHVALMRGDEHVDGGETAVAVGPHGAWTGDVETVLGHWADVAYTYRFGPPAHDRVSAQLHVGETVLHAPDRYPLGRT